MAGLFNVGILDARYKIDIKVEGGLGGYIYFHKKNISKLYFLVRFGASVY